MRKERQIQVVVKTVSYKEAEENDDLYFANMSVEDRFNECLELRRINYFGNYKKSFPRIEKVVKTFKIGEGETD